ncbi:MAG: hypothetical protein ACXWL2_02325 [Candidatus Chromulinivorax sp.]
MKKLCFFYLLLHVIMLIPKPIKNSRSTWTSRYQGPNLVEQEILKQEKNNKNFGKNYTPANATRLQNNINKIDQKNMTQTMLKF